MIYCFFGPHPHLLFNLYNRSKLFSKREEKTCYFQTFRNSTHRIAFHKGKLKSHLLPHYLNELPWTPKLGVPRKSDISWWCTTLWQWVPNQSTVGGTASLLTFWSSLLRGSLGAIKDIIWIWLVRGWNWSDYNPTNDFQNRTQLLLSSVFT